MERQSRKRKKTHPSFRRVKAAASPKPPAAATTPPIVAASQSHNAILPGDLPLAAKKHGVRGGSGLQARGRQSESVSPSKSASSRSTSTNRSPSPARFYRQREQSELQNLNHRLSSHAENVKHLQSENTRLKLDLEGLNVIHLEMQTLRQLHDSDIKTLQELLDTARVEKNNLEEVVECVKQEREVLQQTLADKEYEMSSLEKRMEPLRELSEQYDHQKDDLRLTRECLEEKGEDVKRLRAELLREKVTTKRLEEEGQKNKTRYLQEIEEASTRMNRHLHSTDQKLEADYEQMVTDALTDVRDQHARDLAALKEELTKVYQTKLIEWKTKAERSNADLLALRKGRKAFKAEQDSLRDQTTRLKMDIAALKVQVEEEKIKHQDLKTDAEKERCQLQREMVLLRQELAEAREELEEMGGTNMRLEQQISSYRVIVEDLESNSVFPGTASRGDKQVGDCSATLPGAVMSEVTDGGPRDKVVHAATNNAYLRFNEVTNAIHVAEVDLEGRYVALVNKADHLVDMCLWKIQQTCSRNKVQFEIPFSVPVASNQCLLIWGHQEGPFADKPGGTDDILIAPYVRGSKEDKPNADNRLDTLHIQMRDKHWLRGQPGMMNVRLEDGDGQLQTKCDLTRLQNDLSSTSSASAKSGSRALSKLVNFLPFYDNVQQATHDEDREGSGNGTHDKRRQLYMQCTNKRKHGVEQEENEADGMEERMSDDDTHFHHKDSCFTM